MFKLEILYNMPGVRN